MTDWLEQLRQAAPGAVFLRQEPMSRHTTFQVGGPAECFAEPQNAEELAALIRCCREGSIPYYIIGKGSNLLIGDRGYAGVILHVGAGLAACEIEHDRIYAEAGISLALLAKNACAAGLTGLEFAAGIPGSLGGAVTMNAGAYGGEMKDVLTAVQVVTRGGELFWLTAEQMQLGYRTSAVMKEGYAVTAAEFQLAEGDVEKIKEKMAELAARRREKQPLEYPSAGSTFKRPAGYFAGKLIEEAGLLGFSVGGAQVSEKHCGFVINRGGATAADILALCQEVVRRVKENSGVTLEMEVRCLGEF
ncbi:UDP-N-acetylmuramate dehydrogenase [Cuneatibacter sp. NSJ-177]|uniref:UDP-N-acetylmuramate dehydrogenase n=1 Tax=Cuneatibacter sp. NSJ-177 TaxID=2931401 RepID=UPI001FD3018B|nr:UDP-N-acetylmuramate dehydrogenase [Cuneatibacter sp. NSJ-177]MCJ7833884.1 UDP-N-acetylmuramate dehydrogenase [Cuneatibacter sp. NSJ-177]